MAQYHCGALDLKKILNTFTGSEFTALFKGANYQELNEQQVRKRLKQYIKTGTLFIPLQEGQCPNFSKQKGCPGHRKPQTPPLPMKLIFIDVETTGTKFWKNGIHQISGCVEINGVKIEEFDYKVQPNPDPRMIIEDEALAVAGVTREQVMAYEPMGPVYKKFTALLSKYVSKFDKKDKFWFVGYNSQGFDNPFLRAWFVQNGDNYYGSFFHSVSIDVIVLAAQQLMGARVDMENFKLATVARKLGIVVDDTKLHDALYDIEITRRAYHVLTGLKAVTVEKEINGLVLTDENTCTGTELPTE